MKRNELAVLAGEAAASILLSIIATQATGIKTIIAVNLEKSQVTIIQDLRSQTRSEAPVEGEAQASSSEAEKKAGTARRYDPETRKLEAIEAAG